MPPETPSLTTAQIRDVMVCAATQAWCRSLKFNTLPFYAIEARPWEFDRECFVQTALIVLGHRDVHANDIPAHLWRV